MTARFAFLSAVLCCASLCNAQEPFVRFQPEQLDASPPASPATVVEPVAGQFVYERASAQRANTLRFAIGKAPRTDYVFASPEEQDELRALRDRLTEEQRDGVVLRDRVQTPPSFPKPNGHLRRRPKKAACQKEDHALSSSVNGPHFVRRGSSICVPALGAADSSDWRDHLVCVDEGGANVR